MTRRAQQLDRDQLILDRLAKIEHKVDSIEQTSAFALRPDAAKYFDEVKKIFRYGLRRAQVYLAADGARSVQDIAQHLSMKRQNVGRDLKRLGAEGMLELVDSRGNRDIWAKKPLDRSLRIGPYLCEEYSLQPSGLKQRGMKAGKARRARKKRRPGKRK